MFGCLSRLLVIGLFFNLALDDKFGCVCSIMVVGWGMYVGS